MRSDHLKRHARTHKDILSMDDDEAREELRARHAVQLQREERRQKLKEIAQQENISINHCNEIVSSTTRQDISCLREELLCNNRDYLDKIELCRQIASIIDESVIREESLKENHKEALDLYRKERPRIDIQTVELRPWQQLLMKMIATPSEREVFWICGFKGNEGKSWFQSYLQTLYGYARVVRLDLRNKTSNILHTLSKRPLQTTDIFMFNDTRALDRTDQNYAVLEHIKDGCAVSSKYNSTVINFKTPNILIIFSNNRPNTSNLSTDRWRLYSINKEGLRCINNGKQNQAEFEHREIDVKEQSTSK